MSKKKSSSLPVGCYAPILDIHLYGKKKSKIKKSPTFGLLVDDVCVDMIKAQMRNKNIHGFNSDEW